MENRVGKRLGQALVFSFGPAYLKDLFRFRSEMIGVSEEGVIIKLYYYRLHHDERN